MWAWWALIVVGTVAARAGAFQDAAPPTITAIEIDGIGRLSRSYVEGVVRVRAGDPYRAEVLDEAVTRLLKTGRFWSATYDAQPSEGGVAVTIHLRERPTVTAVRFEGNTHFDDRRLRALVEVNTGDLVDRFTVESGRDAIEAKYRQAGYRDVVVSFDQELLDGSGAVVYRIGEGTRVRVRRIDFVGDETFPRGELMKQIKTRTAIWIFRSGTFEPDQVEQDTIELRNYYRDHGFLDAGVSHEEVLSEGGRDLHLTFRIEPKTRYRIESVTLRGQAAFETAELEGLMQSEVGAFVQRRDLEADQRSILGLYNENGYIHAAVQPTWVYSSEPGLVQVTIDIDEGEQFRVGRVVVRGNRRTKDKVVRRELNMFPPDDLWNLREAREAERRLSQSRIFDVARVFPVGDEPGVRDVIIDVQEAERTGDFIFGVGVTSNSGLVGSVVLDLRNFDILDRPRSFKELAKFESFFGGGQRMRLELEPGRDVNRFRIDFSEPYLFDRPVSLNTSLYLFTRGRDDYSEGRAGTTLSLGRRFERGRLQGWSGELSLRVEGVTVDDLELFVARSIREEQGTNLLTSVKASLARDRTDNRFVPTTGDRLRLSYEQAGVLGGDYVFGKAQVEYTRYFKIAEDEFSRPTVFQLSGEAGAIVGDAPFFERFYAGGIGSIRGFAFRGVGPREGLRDNNIGGDTMLLLSGEYSFPLVGDTMRGLFFLDTGMVDSGLRASVGVGARLTIDFLGPVPLEFNLGLPVLERDGDDTQVFSFFIGTSF
jgi:outer membrane protein insertion porin family